MPPRPPAGWGSGVGGARALLGEYLRTRYTCTALWARIRGKCPAAARALRRGLEDLCIEVRRLLEELGLRTVGEKFDPRLLSEPPTRLAGECLASSRALAAAGSRAAARLAEAAAQAGACLSPGIPGRSPAATGRASLMAHRGSSVGGAGEDG